MTEGQSEPWLVLEQLDENGDPCEGRLVVDRGLYAWDIDEDGSVSARGDLTVPRTRTRHVAVDRS